ncbi:MAG: CRISPR-associated protein Csx19, partial [Promethearchaeota archaeon]
SKNSELYVWKKGNRFALRFREDGKGDELFDVYIANHIIWGTKINNDNILSEEFRGIQIKLPFTKRIITQGDLPLKYVVNNYIKADKTGLINFIDSRLVEFINDKGEVING